MKLAPVVNAIGVSGLLSAFGYAALRAHWNFLGVTAAGGGVPAERYIAETFAVVATLVPLLLFAALVLLLLIGAGKLLARLAPVAAARAARFLPLVLLLALFAAQLMVWKALSAADPLCATDVILGDLRAKQQVHCFEPRHEQPVIVLVLTLAGLAFMTTRGETLTRTETILRVAAVAVALQLPWVYGYRVKSPVYPVVRVAAGGKTVDGLLMLQTGSHVQLWDATAAHGRMRILPASGLVESGPALNAFDVAAKVAASSDPAEFQRICNSYLPPGGP